MTIFSSKTGLIGKLGRACDAIGDLFRRRTENDAAVASSLYENSFLSHTATSPQRKAFLLRLKTRFASQCENSVFLRFFSGCLHRFLLLGTRTFAICTASYLGASAIVAACRTVLFGTYPSAGEYLCAGILLCVLLPLAFTDIPLFQLLKESTVFGGFFVYVHPSDELRDGKKHNGSPALACVLGMLLGGLTWFFGITPIPVIFCVLSLVCLIFTFPEAGLLLIIGLTPFLGLFDTPSINLAVTVSFALIATLFKILRGKKEWHSGPETLPYILFLVGIVLSAFSSYRGSAEAAFLTAVLISGYFLTVNLFRSEKFLSAASTAMVLSAAAISALGIIQYILGKAPSGWMDASLYTAISARTVSVFDNPNVLGAYLTVSFPFAIGLMFSGHGARIRFFGIFSAVLICVCGLLTWSRGCWIGLCVGFFVTLLMISPRSLLLVPVTALGVGACALYSPDTFGARLSHVFSLADSANSYRVRVWNGAIEVLKHCFFTGVGAGDTAFRSIYMEYAVAGAEAAPHSHSIYLQLAISAGIVTLLLFLWFAFLLIKKSFRGPVVPERREASLVCSAAFGAFCAMLVTGIVDQVFYNYRILFLFFCVCGIYSAAADLRCDGGVKIPNDREASEITVRFYKGGK